MLVVCILLIEHRRTIRITVTPQRATLVKIRFAGYSSFGSLPSSTVSPKELNKSSALFLAGHPALDFLNTRMRVNEDLVDLLQSDEDVFTWLKKAGFSAPTIAAGTGPLALLRCARRLRESMRSLVEERKAGRQGDPSILN